jgi:hypothetical protein
MTLYRYRTPALAGPWRETPDAALEDAVKAGQARHDASGRQIAMLIGRIEVAEEVAVAGGEVRKAA